jgi:hypothetical protein
VLDNFKSYPGICLKELKKITKIFSQDSLYPVLDLNSSLFKLDYKVLPTEPEPHSLKSIQDITLSKQ